MKNTWPKKWPLLDAHLRRQEVNTCSTVPWVSCFHEVCRKLDLFLVCTSIKTRARAEIYGTVYSMILFLLHCF